MSERQTGATLREIRADHTARYSWAANYLSGWITPPKYVVDAACGCGYGTAIIADALPHAFVAGIDNSGEALRYAARHWKRQNNAFTEMDVAALDVTAQVDAIVSFETMEHTDRYVDFADAAFAALRPGGEWLVSVPNQQILKFNKRRWPFHVRHFTPDELAEVLQAARFEVHAWYGQQLRGDNEVTAGRHRAKHIIAVAGKPCM